MEKFILIGRVIINVSTIQTVQKDSMGVGKNKPTITCRLKTDKEWESTGFEIFETIEERDKRFDEILEQLTNKTKDGEQKI